MKTVARKLYSLVCKTTERTKNNFPKLKEHLKLNGMLWVSWSKGGQLDTELSLPKMISIGYDFGLVESTWLCINSTWSALKYRNIYGKFKLYIYECCLNKSIKTTLFFIFLKL